jgi:hypothetical protein
MKKSKPCCLGREMKNGLNPFLIWVSLLPKPGFIDLMPELLVPLGEFARDKNILPDLVFLYTGFSI